MSDFEIFDTATPRVTEGASALVGWTDSGAQWDTPESVRFSAGIGHVFIHTEFEGQHVAISLDREAFDALRDAVEVAHYNRKRWDARDK